MKSRSSSKLEKIVSAAEPCGIVREDTPQFDLYVKSDGTDYVRIWEDFMASSLPDMVTLSEKEKHKVCLAHVNGRPFIFKSDRDVPKNWETKLWRILRGPFHSRQMRKVSRAVGNGCSVVPDIYLVAEKKNGWICGESHIIMEYIPGHSLGREMDIAPFRASVVKAFEELHRHGLALSDANPGNFIVTEDGLKIVDLSWHGLLWTGKAKDAVAAKKYYGVDVPVRGLLGRLALWYILAKRRFRKTFGTDRSKLG